MENLSEKKQLRRWVENWRIAGERLEQIRREDIRNCSVQNAILALNDAFASALRHNPSAATSGLVEQQQIFKRWWEK